MDNFKISEETRGNALIFTSRISRDVPRANQSWQKNPWEVLASAGVVIKGNAGFEIRERNCSRFHKDPGNFTISPSVRTFSASLFENNYGRNSDLRSEYHSTLIYDTFEASQESVQSNISLRVGVMEIIFQTNNSSRRELSFEMKEKKKSSMQGGGKLENSRGKRETPKYSFNDDEKEYSSSAIAEDETLLRGVRPVALSLSSRHHRPAVNSSRAALRRWANKWFLEKFSARRTRAASGEESRARRINLNYKFHRTIGEEGREGRGKALILLLAAERREIAQLEASERINLIYLSFIWLSATPPDVRQWRRRRAPVQAYGILEEWPSALCTDVREYIARSNDLAGWIMIRWLSALN